MLAAASSKWNFLPFNRSFLDAPSCAWNRTAGRERPCAPAFAAPSDSGFTHAITMDADGQHFAEDLPKLSRRGAGAARRAHRWACAISTRRAARRIAGAPTRFPLSGFASKPGVRLGDTQCGFRCYPLPLTQRLKTRSGRYAFELEFMVRAAWVGTPIVAVPVKCIYEPGQLAAIALPAGARPRAHHDDEHRPGAAIVVCAALRCARRGRSGSASRCGKPSAEFFAEHAHEPWRMAVAVGLGLFIGIAPIWGLSDGRGGGRSPIVCA